MRCVGEMNSTQIKQNLKFFSERWANYQGNEISEAQTFINDFFGCFGTDRKDVGAMFESKISFDSTRADLIWKDKLLIEMKRPSENDFGKHYNQIYNYWIKINPSPKYVIISNFKKFEIHDPFIEYGKPLITIKTTDLHKNIDSFMFMVDKAPLFPKTKTEVTKKAAERTIEVYHSLLSRYPILEVRVFILQCVFAMFAERINLLPGKQFTNALYNCLTKDEKTGDLLTLLFQRLNFAEENKRRGRDIPYFNGGLFKDVYLLDLTKDEIKILVDACSYDWSRIRPEIFGTLFEKSMSDDERAAKGAHYTSEIDIQRIIDPNIIQPWTETINSINTVKDIEIAKKNLANYKIFDPACGSGNFLYIAFKEVKKIEYQLFKREHELFGNNEHIGKIHPIFPINNLYGCDKDPFAVMLARVTLWIGQQMLHHEYDYFGNDLPLPDLSNIKCADSLLFEWPKEISTYIGNPPYIGSKKMRQRLGNNYVDTLYKLYPDHNKQADYCTYFFRKIHEEMGEGARAGLVGTNTIRENNTRKASLDYITNNNGKIFNAWSSYKWSGQAQVHVSIVNWIKGVSNHENELNGKKVPEISSRLVAEKSQNFGKKLDNEYSNIGFIGVSPRGKGFILTIKEGELLLSNPKNSYIVKPYLKARSFQSKPNGHFDSYIIDFGNMSQEYAEEYVDCFKIVEERVKPFRVGLEDKKDNHESKIYWWQFHKKRNELRSRITELDKYIAVARHSKRPIFSFVESKVLPGDSLVTVASSSQYLLGLLSSRFHTVWAWANGSTLKGDLRYTPTSILETFPFPIGVTKDLVNVVSLTMQEILEERKRLMELKNIGLTKLYNKNYASLNKLHEKLDKLVCEAYNFSLKEVETDEQIRAILFNLNQQY